MNYYFSLQHGVKVRIDAEKNEAFVKRGRVETPLWQRARLGVDVVVENNHITKKEYEKD